MFQQLENHFGRLADVRILQDPWGLGFTLGILRADHPDWETWQSAHREEDPITRTLTEVQLTLATERQQALEAQLQGQHGFRRRRLTRQRRKQMAQGSVTPQEVIHRTLQQVPTTDLLRMGDEDLNSKKPGLAEILLRSLCEGGMCWSGVLNEETDEPVPDTTPNRLRFLGYVGVLIEQPGQPNRYLTLDAFEGLSPEDAISQALQKGEATSTTLDGQPASSYWVDDGRPYGGQSAGDALTCWLLDEAELTAAYSSAWEEEAEDFLPAPSSGGTDTGSLSS